MHTNKYTYTYGDEEQAKQFCRASYGVASISKLLKIIGLFCKRALSKRRYSANETYNFEEPTHRSHPIALQGGQDP